MGSRRVLTRQRAVIADHSAAVHESSFAPYAAPSEHLSDMLLRFDWLIKRQIARGHARKPASIVDFVAIREQRAQHLLDGLTPETTSEANVRWIDQTLQRLQRQIGARIEQSHAHGVRLPLVELARRFALTSREIDLLFACAVVEIDRRYERIYGFLHDDMSRRLASPGVAISLHSNAAGDEVATRSLLNAHAPLRHFRLIDLVDDGTSLPWLSRSMRVDERIVSFIVGDHAIDPRIARHETWLGPGADPRYRALLRCAAEMGSVVFASGDEAWRWPLPQEPVTLRIVELHADGIIDQMNAWQAMSNNELGDTERHRLASLYPMSVATIRDVWRMAQATTHGDQTMPTFDQVEQACRKFASPPVGALAP